MQFASEFIVGNSLSSITYRRYVALRVLDQAPAIGGEVIDHPWHVKNQLLEVDQVQVGSHSRCNQSAVVQSVHKGGCASLAVDYVLQ